MATLMEKDVLIEVVAHAQAIVTMRVDVNSPFTEEEMRLGEIRNFLYANNPEDISFSEIVDEVNSIKAKYEHKPLMPQYR